MKRPLCTLVYEQNEWITDCGVVSQTTLKRCIPDDGVFLFEIKATYAKQVPSCKYYYLGTSTKDARERFTNTMSWMKITEVRLIPPGEEAERVLTDPKRMP